MPSSLPGRGLPVIPTHNRNGVLITGSAPSQALIAALGCAKTSTREDEETT